MSNSMFRLRACLDLSFNDLYPKLTGGNIKYKRLRDYIAIIFLIIVIIREFVSTRQVLSILEKSEVIL